MKGLPKGTFRLINPLPEIDDYEHATPTTAWGCRDLLAKIGIRVGRQCADGSYRITLPERCVTLLPEHRGALARFGVAV